MPPSRMEGGSYWCRVQAQLAFFPYHLLLLVAKANLGCFDSCMYSAEGHLLNTLSYFICYCHFLTLADFVMVQTLPPQNHKAGEEKK